MELDQGISPLRCCRYGTANISALFHLEAAACCSVIIGLFMLNEVRGIFRHDHWLQAQATNPTSPLVTDDPDDVAATGATTDPSAFGLETG